MKSSCVKEGKCDKFFGDDKKCKSECSKYSWEKICGDKNCKCKQSKWVKNLIKREVKIAVGSICPDLNFLQFSVVTMLVRKVLKHCKGYCQDTEEESERKCKKEWMRRGRGGKCGDKNGCCEGCKYGCQVPKCSDKCNWKGTGKCCKNCKCGCQDAKEESKKECCKTGECCKNCECGCQDNKSECKGKCYDNTCKRGECNGISRGCCLMKDVKCMVKKLLSDEKDKFMQMMQISLDTFVKVKGIPLPPENSRPPKHLIKMVAMLLCKMHKKGAETKECQEKVATKFWEGACDAHLKKMKCKVRELVSKVVYYRCDGCEGPICQGMIRVITKTLTAMFIVKMIKNMTSEFKKGDNKEGKPEDICKLCSPCGFMEHKRMKRMMIRCWTKFGVKFTVAFIKANKDSASACLEANKSTVDEYLKGKKLPSCCSPKEFKKCVLGCIVAEAIVTTCGEKKSNDFYVDLGKRVLHGCDCLCSRKHIKSCRKLAKTALLLNGVKDKTTVHVASHWASAMCCQVSNGDDCSKENCIEFLNNWVKGYTPVVEEALKAMKELKDECKSECKEDCKCGRMKYKIMRRTLLEYLKVECADGKFNKDKLKERMKKFKDMVCKIKEECEKCCCTESCCIDAMKKHA